MDAEAQLPRKQSVVRLRARNISQVKGTRPVQACRHPYESEARRYDMVLGVMDATQIA